MFQLALFVDFENKHMKNNEIDTGTNVPGRHPIFSQKNQYEFS
jgi:hypothetical protein